MYPPDRRLHGNNSVLQLLAQALTLAARVLAIVSHMCRDYMYCSPPNAALAHRKSSLTILSSADMATSTAMSTTTTMTPLAAPIEAGGDGGGGAHGSNGGPTRVCLLDALKLPPPWAGRTSTTLTQNSAHGGGQAVSDSVVLLLSSDADSDEFEGIEDE